MKLSIDSDNILRVDGGFLQIGKTSPEKLHAVLVQGRWLIEQAIENTYQKYAMDPELTVRRGSVWVMRLAKEEAKVITPLGLILDSFSQEDRGVFTNWLDVRPKFWPYWQAAWNAGLLAEARTASNAWGIKGFCLLVYLKGSR